MTADRKFRLPKDISLDEYPKPEAFLTEARRLIDEAQKQGLSPAGDGPIRAPLPLSRLCRPVRAHGAAGRAASLPTSTMPLTQHRGNVVSRSDSEVR